MKNSSRTQFKSSGSQNQVTKVASSGSQNQVTKVASSGSQNQVTKVASLNMKSSTRTQFKSSDSQNQMTKSASQNTQYHAKTKNRADVTGRVRMLEKEEHCNACEVVAGICQRDPSVHRNSTEHVVIQRDGGQYDVNGISLDISPNGHMMLKPSIKFPNNAPEMFGFTLVQRGNKYYLGTATDMKKFVDHNSDSYPQFCITDGKGKKFSEFGEYMLAIPIRSFLCAIANYNKSIENKATKSAIEKKKKELSLARKAMDGKTVDFAVIEHLRTQIKWVSGVCDLNNIGQAALSQVINSKCCVSNFIPEMVHILNTNHIFNTGLVIESTMAYIENLHSAKNEDEIIQMLRSKLVNLSRAKRIERFLTEFGNLLNSMQLIVINAPPKKKDIYKKDPSFFHDANNMIANNMNIQGVTVLQHSMSSDARFCVFVETTKSIIEHFQKTYPSLKPLVSRCMTLHENLTNDFIDESPTIVDKSLFGDAKSENIIEEILLMIIQTFIPNKVQQMLIEYRATYDVRDIYKFILCNMNIDQSLFHKEKFDLLRIIVSEASSLSIAEANNEQMNCTSIFASYFFVTFPFGIVEKLEEKLNDSEEVILGNNDSTLFACQNRREEIKQLIDSSAFKQSLIKSLQCYDKIHTSSASNDYDKFMHYIKINDKFTDLVAILNEIRDYNDAKTSEHASKAKKDATKNHYNIVSEMIEQYKDNDDMYNVLRVLIEMSEFTPRIMKWFIIKYQDNFADLFLEFLTKVEEDEHQQQIDMIQKLQSDKNDMLELMNSSCVQMVSEHNDSDNDSSDNNLEELVVECNELADDILLTNVDIDDVVQTCDIVKESLMSISKSVSKMFYECVRRKLHLNRDFKEQVINLCFMDIFDTSIFKVCPLPYNNKILKKLSDEIMSLDSYAALNTCSSLCRVKVQKQLSRDQQDRNIDKELERELENEIKFITSSQLIFDTIKPKSSFGRSEQVKKILSVREKDRIAKAEAKQLKIDEKLKREAEHRLANQSTISDSRKEERAIHDMKTQLKTMIRERHTKAIFQNQCDEIWEQRQQDNCDTIVKSDDHDDGHDDGHDDSDDSIDLDEQSMIEKLRMFKKEDTKRTKTTRKTVTKVKKQQKSGKKFHHE